MLPAGIWGLLATPFNADGSAVDIASLTRLVESYLPLNLAGLTVLGVFGEAADLTPTERREVVRIVHDLSPRTQLVVGVTSLSTEAAIDEIHNVADVGGDSITAYLVQVNSSDPEAVIEHLTRIHAATGGWVMAQDYPPITGVDITGPDLIQVIEACPFVCAVKLEAAPTPHKVAMLTSCSTVPVFGGLGASYLLDELGCGGAGAMTGFTVPEGLIECYEAYREGGFAAARAAWLPYLPLVNFEFQAGFARTIRKEGLKRRGLIDHATSRTGSVVLTPEISELLDLHLANTPHTA